MKFFFCPAFSTERISQWDIFFFSTDCSSKELILDGFVIDVEPKGKMIIMKNKDIPGVVGKVGNILGENGINISDFRLSRGKEGTALAVILNKDEKANSKVGTPLRLPGTKRQRMTASWAWQSRRSANRWMGDFPPSAAVRRCRSARAAPLPCSPMRLLDHEWWYTVINLRSDVKSAWRSLRNGFLRYHPALNNKNRFLQLFLLRQGRLQSV